MNLLFFPVNKTSNESKNSLDNNNLKKIIIKTIIYSILWRNQLLRISTLKFKCENKLRNFTLFNKVEGTRFGFYIEKNVKTTLKNRSKIIEFAGTSFISGLNNLVYYNINLKKNYIFEKSDICFGYCFIINNNKTKFLVYTKRYNFINK